MAPVALLTLLLCTGGLLVCRRWPPLMRHLPWRSLQLGAVVGNTAYVGLPVALALLPPHALSVTITVDLIGTLVTWSLGPLLLQGHGRPRAMRLLALLWRTPACKALCLALPLALTPWSGLIGQWLWWPARLILWSLLVLVGMRLAPLVAELGPAGGGRRVWSELLPALAIKLLLWPALVWALAVWIPVPPAAVAAVVLQAAAPTAMSVLLLAEASSGPDRVAEVNAAVRIVLSSTVAALLTLPLWWWLLRWWQPSLSGS
jgi:predicted permease